MSTRVKSALFVLTVSATVSAALNGCDSGSGTPEHNERSPIVTPIVMKQDDVEAGAEPLSAAERLNEQINQQVINDAIRRWNTAVVSMPSSTPDSFNRSMLCVQAQMVVAAYLQAHRADGVAEWHKTVQQYCGSE